MSDGNAWIEIVLLAMLAAFIGLRLVSVLGKRTGQERPIGDSFRAPAEVTAPPRREAERPVRGELLLPPGTDGALRGALEAIADADAGFVPDRFLSGARSVYQMVLEGFWAGNVGGLTGLVSDEIIDNLASAVEARGGKTLANRLIAIDSATLHGATLVGQMVEVTVRFVARIATADGETESRDLWTFSRLAGNPDPAWVLIATDNEADSTDLPPDHG
ncbi:Tim44/TimA family putative adaptor protein [Sandarakinorhabdus rubra]|uniref:Tim44/TimA family putative adaptor protein n=1 Tax=Sandarakinorhabdus rubra TaxID=2672568 RepID=UPI0013DA9628|nr:Tim44/TimA family putative adaptor protein [Sandarakinorhabdus rubra]